MDVIRTKKKKKHKDDLTTWKNGSTWKKGHLFWTKQTMGYRKRKQTAKSDFVKKCCINVMFFSNWHSFIYFMQISSWIRMTFFLLHRLWQKQNGLAEVVRRWLATRAFAGVKGSASGVTSRRRWVSGSIATATAAHTRNRCLQLYLLLYVWPVY